jgi:molybdate transport repressor ModE-like protein
MAGMDWGRVRIFLAVARTGQILGAARQLGVNHATVARQLTALESELGAKVVERRMNGCVLTQAGEALLVSAEKVESEFLKLESGLSGVQGAVSGSVRVGAPEALGNYVLAPSLADFAARHQGLVIQLIPLPRVFSLSRREADIVITVDRPTNGHLIIQKLTDYTLGLYASSRYLASHGAIRREEDLEKHLFITYVDDLLNSAALDYAQKLIKQSQHRFECGTVIGQLEAARAGHGVAILHDYCASRYPELKRVLARVQFVRSYWLTSHPDTHDAHRVAEVRRHIAETVSAARGRFVFRSVAVKK